jgi:ketosteroid isomerase-like protein
MMGCMSRPGVESIAEKVRAALDSADLEQFADLLDPHVTWGAPGDPSPSCHNRSQVLAWYANGRAAGRRGHVRSVATYDDKILVTMTVTSPDDNGTERWQVLTVANGRVADIRGYDDEAAAFAAAGVSG